MRTVLDQVLMEDLKRYRAVVLLQSKMISSLTIIPCPGVYSLTSTWLGSLSLKTPREAILLPQTSNHCTWKRCHMMVVHRHVHLLKTYARQLLSNHSLGMSGGESACFQTPIEPSTKLTFGWGIPPESRTIKQYHMIHLHCVLLCIHCIIEVSFPGH